MATIKDYSTEIEAQMFDNMSHGCCCSKLFATQRSDVNVLTDAMESDSNNGNLEDIQVFDESSHRDEVSASLMQSTHVSEDLVSASINPIMGSSATREGEVFDNFSQGAGQTFQEFSPMADDFEIICPIHSKELESESEDCGSTHLIILAYRLPFYHWQWRSKDEYAMQATNFGFHIFIYGVNDFLLSPWISITNNATDLVPTMLPEEMKQRSTSAKVIEQPWLQWEEASDKPIDHVVLSKLKQFRVICNLMKPAIKVIAADFSEEEIKYLKYVFASMDTNNSGTITYERIKSGLARLASKLSEAKVQQLMQASVLKFEGSFDWIILFLLQDNIHSAISCLARLISLRLDGDPNCCTVMLLLPRCQAEL
ncbi:calcium-dependent protein kinase isoform 2 [Nicotiana attenuata]|uniref:Calcium-dependent protein kinase isoform 2 n=1 Tax=Nicotiana attenuata TaxID=49451 RepID=A0A314L2Q0_NICAT|nr:calcium-dependent protein kinase isoform 2 [Nicotiana attenuata]